MPFILSWHDDELGELSQTYVNRADALDVAKDRTEQRGVEYVIVDQIGERGHLYEWNRTTGTVEAEPCK